jgi:SAM-dependent methyltransferase
MGQSWEDLVAEAEAAPIDGWDFSWLNGRATEDRPSWGYSRLVAQRYATAASALDLQSGGGEMLAGLPGFPRLMVATEGFAPNVTVAAKRLASLGVHVVACNDERPALPFADRSFALVTSRHPIVAWWEEIARVLQPGGRYLSQEVGPYSMRALSEFMMGPLPEGSEREPGLARAAAEAAGLSVIDLRSERLRTVFYDVGAVVYYLRLVIWIVPGFTASAYRDRLLALHEQIAQDGHFEATASRFLIEASKPG